MCKVKTLITFCAVLLTATLMAMPKAGFAGKQTTINIKDGDPVIIHIWENGSTSTDGGPRTQPPFIAEYYSSCDAVLLGSLENVGNVAVTLSSTAGDWYQTVFNSGGSPILVPVSGASGQYTLTLVTSDGTTYTGEFVL